MTACEAERLTTRGMLELNSGNCGALTRVLRNRSP